MRSAERPAARRALRWSWSTLPDRRPSVGRGVPRADIRKEPRRVKRDVREKFWVARGAAAPGPLVSIAPSGGDAAPSVIVVVHFPDVVLGVELKSERSEERRVGKGSRC